MLHKESARIHLLPARSAPIVCIVRRKPSKSFHIIRWNTSTDHFEHGGWLRGKLYVMRCDVSFDGNWMVFLAMGAAGTAWNGICKLPWLNTPYEFRSEGTSFGGGYWSKPDLLLLNKWQPRGKPLRVPFRTATYHTQHGDDDQGVLYPRLERDGWRRAGAFGQERKIESSKKNLVACENDAGWFWKPSPAHPTLRAFYRGYLDHGRTFEFALDEYPGLLGPDVEWATWDSLGQLITTRAGGVAKYDLQALARGCPSIEKSFEDLVPPGTAK
jgi:hypothetical protein